MVQEEKTQQNTEKKNLDIGTKRSGLNLFIQFLIAAIFFVGGLVASNTLFEERPLFNVQFLAEAAISVTSALFGFYLVPKYFLILKRWFEELVGNTMYRLVSDFYNQYTKKVEDNRKERESKKKKEVKRDMQEKLKNGVLVDTSVLIDGRIIKLAQTGIFVYPLIIPKKVVEELHLLADNKKDAKRQKGRRGLDLLNDLKKSTKIIVLNETSSNGTKDDGADAELLNLAKQFKLKVMTLDYNLSKVAEVSNVKTINLNELAKALKPEYIPGDTLNVKIVQEGKEEKQGVGYLPDGTMIVVADGGGKVGQDVDVVVSKLIQTNAGTMIFCEIS
jgi:uncharacterized protein YacL